MKRDRLCGKSSARSAYTHQTLMKVVADRSAATKVGARLSRRWGRMDSGMHLLGPKNKFCRQTLAARRAIVVARPSSCIRENQRCIHLIRLLGGLVAAPARRHDCTGEDGALLPVTAASIPPRWINCSLYGSNLETRRGSRLH